MRTSVEVAEYIGQLLKIKNMSAAELARRTNMNKSSISRYFKGDRKIPMDEIPKFAKALGLQPEELLIKDTTSDIVSSTTTEKSSDEYEVLCTEYYYFTDVCISAGQPFSVDAVESFETILIPDKIMGKYAGDQTIFFAHVNGDSMNKVIPHGSLIAVKPVSTENLKDGDIVVFSCCHEYSVKRFYADGNRLIFKPESNDHRFADYIVDKAHEEVRLHGKVVTYIVNSD